MGQGSRCVLSFDLPASVSRTDATLCLNYYVTVSTASSSRIVSSQGSRAARSNGPRSAQITSPSFVSFSPSFPLRLGRLTLLRFKIYRSSLSNRRNLIKFNRTRPVRRTNASHSFSRFHPRIVIFCILSRRHDSLVLSYSSSVFQRVKSRLRQTSRVCKIKRKDANDETRQNGG